LKILFAIALLGVLFGSALPATASSYNLNDYIYEVDESGLSGSLSGPVGREAIDAAYTLSLADASGSASILDVNYSDILNSWVLHAEAERDDRFAFGLGGLNADLIGPGVFFGMAADGDSLAGSGNIGGSLLNFDYSENAAGAEGNIEYTPLISRRRFFNRLLDNVSQHENFSLSYQLINDLRTAQIFYKNYQLSYSETASPGQANPHRELLIKEVFGDELAISEDGFMLTSGGVLVGEGTEDLFARIEDGYKTGHFDYRYTEGNRQYNFNYDRSNGAESLSGRIVNSQSHVLASLDLTMTGRAFDFTGSVYGQSFDLTQIETPQGIEGTGGLTQVHKPVSFAYRKVGDLWSGEAHYKDYELVYQQAVLPGLGIQNQAVLTNQRGDRIVFGEDDLEATLNGDFSNVASFLDFNWEGQPSIELELADGNTLLASYNLDTRLLSGSYDENTGSVKIAKDGYLTFDSKGHTVQLDIGFPQETQLGYTMALRTVKFKSGLMRIDFSNTLLDWSESTDILGLYADQKYIIKAHLLDAKVMEDNLKTNFDSFDDVRWDDAGREKFIRSTVQSVDVNMREFRSHVYLGNPRWDDLITLVAYDVGEFTMSQNDLVTIANADEPVEQLHSFLQSLTGGSLNQMANEAEKNILFGFGQSLASLPVIPTSQISVMSQSASIEPDRAGADPTVGYGYWHMPKAALTLTLPPGSPSMSGISTGDIYQPTLWMNVSQVMRQAFFEGAPQAGNSFAPVSADAAAAASEGATSSVYMPDLSSDPNVQFTRATSVMVGNSSYDFGVDYGEMTMSLPTFDRFSRTRVTLEGMTDRYFGRLHKKIDVWDDVDVTVNGLVYAYHFPYSPVVSLADRFHEQSWLPYMNRNVLSYEVDAEATDSVMIPGAMAGVSLRAESWYADLSILPYVPLNITFEDELEIKPQNISSLSANPADLTRALSWATDIKLGRLIRVFGREMTLYANKYVDDNLISGVNVEVVRNIEVGAEAGTADYSNVNQTQLNTHVNFFGLRTGAFVEQNTKKQTHVVGGNITRVFWNKQVTASGGKVYWDNSGVNENIEDYVSLGTQMGSCKGLTSLFVDKIAQSKIYKNGLQFMLGGRHNPHMTIETSYTDGSFYPDSYEVYSRIGWDL
jgi:hypothetical protein